MGAALFFLPMLVLAHFLLPKVVRLALPFFMIQTRSAREIEHIIDITGTNAMLMGFGFTYLFLNLGTVLLLPQFLLTHQVDLIPVLSVTGAIVLCLVVSGLAIYFAFRDELRIQRAIEGSVESQ
jgi:hypothetical protein